ncbi:hypothetical protein J5H37_11995 [Stenotrophomonas maltophilia]|uniref:hypothetical protein n=1 Tax=Stenotrophomonas maltophilia TaxID=40324 RepID=UPI0019D44E43|nr:hypothetical protein [Stenotrophomonas maltophilia]MBN7830656.1 hypothetical protein [Stenotrophomonas maltophilia]MBN7834883.1 hypothetical protein [Stenotrophomonas maltophilia]MBN7858783.1 hypothetical protein [Stenotrophomonas maltophilia]MBN7918233.1 hypothetical protein [Stenotrophomonas maltophilia]MBO2845357.1 hypothetical protein [Stenotrophomonas maltophilia]
MNQLDTISPPSRNLEFRGEQLHLTPLRLQQIGPFITASRTLIARVAMMAGAVEGSERAAVGAILLDLLEQDGTEIAAALAVVTGRDAEWIAGATLDEIADLLEVVIGLNRDFFAHRLRRLLLQAKLQTDESTGSPTSSST